MPPLHPSDQLDPYYKNAYTDTLKQNQQSYVRSLVHLMDDNGWVCPDQLKALMRMLNTSLIALENNIQSAEGKEEDEAKKFSQQVTD